MSSFLFTKSLASSLAYRLTTTISGTRSKQREKMKKKKEKKKRVDQYFELSSDLRLKRATVFAELLETEKRCERRKRDCVSQKRHFPINNQKKRKKKKKNNESKKEITLAPKFVESDDLINEICAPEALQLRLLHLLHKLGIT